MESTNVNSLRKSTLPVLLAALLLISLAGPTSAAERITAMLAASHAGDAFNQAIQAFTAESGIEVEIIEFATWNDLREKLPVMVAGGISPDVVYHDQGAQADLYHNGVLQPIEEYVARDAFDLSVWPQPLVDAYRYDGRLYSLPTGVSNFVTFYNVGKMYEAGLSDLPTDWDGVEFTFDEMLDKSRKLTRDADGDGTPEQYGISGWFSSGAQGIHFWGIDWFDDDQTEFLGTNSQHLEAIEEIRQLYTLGVIGGNWMNGTAVMMPMQPYYLNRIADAMDQGGFFDWSLGVLPIVECRCAPSGFHSMGLVAGASNPDGGWEFIKFMTTDPSGTINFSRAENRTPVVPASIDDFYDRWERLNPGMNADVFTSGLNHIFRPNEYGLPRAVFNNLSAALSRIMQGQQDPRLGMEELKPVLDGILKEMHASK